MSSTLINGVAYTWSQVTVTIGKIDVYGIDKISYTEEQEMVNNYGKGNKPISRGYGKITYEAALTLHMGEIENLQRSSPTGRLQDIAEFDITISFMVEGSNLITTHKIKQCRFMNNGRELNQGDTKIATELKLIVGDIDYRAAA